MTQLVWIAILIAMPLGAVPRGYQETSQNQTQDAKPKKDEKGLSKDQVFLEAARKGDNDAVKQFLTAGMDANLVEHDDDRSTVLMVAAMAGQTETVKLLLAGGAKPNTKSKQGRTALTWASWRGMNDTVKALLDNGADINTRDQWGGSPLNFAVDKGRTETVMVLLNAGANPNFPHSETGQTALIDAVVRGHIEIVKSLLEKGANVNDQDRSGRKPVDWARRTNRVQIEVLLRKAAAK